MLFNLLLGSAAVTTAASVPRNTPRLAATDEYIWQIAKWQAGESHGNPATPITGWYDFNVSAAEYGQGAARIPPFAAHCEGVADGRPLASEYAGCTLTAADGTSSASVSARVLPEQDVQAHIAISYVFDSNDESSTERNFTVVVVEDWARERPPHDFTVQPTETQN
ncbi:hypothetical protein F4820DRAFT_401141 [Hypoxylon rubiginosum]|uniref:Uncharacterized protein n=1 Tax=Hypoxylon rubiginosum TaxID=110542 RepID=A0ACB9ZJR8_9PEZI|nr:hypothetical protein F4820DRAFT_401141 [Hypoxylon rubiginosum]